MGDGRWEMGDGRRETRNRKDNRGITIGIPTAGKLQSLGITLCSRALKQ